MFIAMSSLFGQSGQAAMSPTTVVAGKQITVTITLNEALPEGTDLVVRLAPKDPKDGQALGFNLSPKDNDRKVCAGSYAVPLNAKGTWHLQVATISIPNGGNSPLDTNRPDFTVTPVKITLPTKGTVVVTAP
jgi:hypothetical protein